MDQEGKQLFAYLELKTNNITQLDNLIINLKGLNVNRIKNYLIPVPFPLLGGNILKSIYLILELLDFIGDSIYFLIEIVRTIIIN